MGPNLKADHLLSERDMLFKILERVLEAYNEGCPIPKNIIYDIENVLPPLSDNLVT